MTEACKTDIYPRYCFHLSPTVNTWCFLPACRIHALQQHAGFEGENFFFYKNLPIKWARIVGPVVAIDEFFGRRVFTVDDSSGRCIEVWVLLQSAAPGSHASRQQQSVSGARAEASTEASTMSRDSASPGPYSEIDIGNVLDVKGSLSKFKEETQIKIEKLAVVKSTAHEIILWRKRTAFQRDVLDKPWVLEPATIRRCRKDAEASEAMLERRRRRRQPSTRMNTGRNDTTQPSSAPSSKATRTKQHNKTTQHADVAARLKELIQDGSVKGKYSALGL